MIEFVWLNAASKELPLHSRGHLVALPQLFTVMLIVLFIRLISLNDTTEVLYFF